MNYSVDDELLCRLHILFSAKESLRLSTVLTADIN